MEANLMEANWTDESEDVVFVEDCATYIELCHHLSVRGSVKMQEIPIQSWGDTIHWATHISHLHVQGTAQLQIQDQTPWKVALAARHRGQTKSHHLHNIILT